jgi:DNA polymerase III alpha subunit (gram-positive type)
VEKCYVFFDIETARQAQEILSMEKPPIISIYAQAVVAETGELLGKPFDEKIKFRIDRADQKVLDLIHYSEEDWQTAKPPAMVADMFSAYVKQYAWVERTGKNGKFYNAVLAGHNIKLFDVPVLLQWYRGLAKHYSRSFFINTWYSPSIDTLHMATAYEAVTNVFHISNKLDQLCEKCGIILPEHHTAKDDTLASIALWKKLKSMFLSLS